MVAPGALRSDGSTGFSLRLVLSVHAPGHITGVHYLIYCPQLANFPDKEPLIVALQCSSERAQLTDLLTFHRAHSELCNTVFSSSHA